MDVSIVLTIGEAIAGAIGGITIGARLQDSSFGKAVNAFIGLVGGVHTWLFADHHLAGPCELSQQRLVGCHLGQHYRRACWRGSSDNHLRAGERQFWSVRKDRLRR